jgi:hypothetical protein
MTSPLVDARPQLAGVTPLVRRAGALDPRTVVRIVLDTRAIAAYVRLPFDVLVGRTVAVRWDGARIDCAVRGQELIRWLDGEVDVPPSRRDTEWRGAVPPNVGWRRVETIPDDVVRDVVRKGASTFREAAEREGVPGARPRADVADALLDSVVLTAVNGPMRAEVTLRSISALTRMGFLPEGSHAAVDICGRWLRIAARYGSAYAERPGMAMGIVS